MDSPTRWFVALILVAVIALVAGRLLGKRSATLGLLVVLFSVAFISFWSWLQHRPDVAVGLIPTGTLQYLEGTASVPFFMLILGVAWAKARRLRQYGFLAVGAMVAMMLFMQGGIWMVQATPAHAFDQDIVIAPVVMQSQDYSCVSAASATALNLMGFHTTEAQMAQYTHTRPRTGSTSIRAMDGLQRRLTGSDIKPRMVQADIQKLPLLPAPMLVTVNFDNNRAYNHMIVLMSTSAEGAEVADPQDGTFFMPWSALRDAITGPAIVFDRSSVQHAMVDHTPAPTP